jgi:ATP-binding cassette, subfamily B (MDR/TAP), member 1
MSYSSEKKLTFFFGILAAVVNGLIFPVFTIFLSKMLNVLIKFSDDPVQARKDSNLYALIFLLLGVLAFIVNVIQAAFFSSIGE